MATPSVDRIVELVKERFPDVGSLGIWNRRYIAGTKTWSQHAYGNAWDIASPSHPIVDAIYLDEVYTWLREWKRQGEPIGTILWRVPGHYDHIHVEGTPKRTGTPPTNRKDDDMETKALIKEIQETLKYHGYVGANGLVLKIDGIWGWQTQYAFRNALAPGEALRRGTTFTATVQ